MSDSGNLLLIVGDSITLGAMEILGQEILARVEPTYVECLTQRLPQLAIVTDAALYRTTSAACQVIGELLERHTPDLVLLMIGGNDADIDWKRFIISGGRIARSRVAADRYAENLLHLVGQVQAAGACPILTDFPNHQLALRTAYLERLAVGCDLRALIEQLGGQAESDRHLETFRQAAREVTRQTEAFYVSYGPALAAHDAGFGPDGAHPNAAGHGLIAEILAPTLARARQIRQDYARRIDL